VRLFVSAIDAVNNRRMDQSFGPVRRLSTGRNRIDGTGPITFRAAAALFCAIIRCTGADAGFAA